MARRRLHGFDVPVNDIPFSCWAVPVAPYKWTRFPNALYDWNSPVLLLRERSMVGFMDEVTDLQDWISKVNNDDVIKDFWRERVQLGKSANRVQEWTEHMFDYCLDELRSYAKFHEMTDFVPCISLTSTVFKSDNLIPKDLNNRLRLAIVPLEAKPEREKDWHPGSDGKILDLVDPSLFPLLYGRTRLLSKEAVPLADCFKSIGNGGIVPVPEPDHLSLAYFSQSSSWPAVMQRYFYSSKFQWLPFEVNFGKDKSIHISSYINNLHPDGNEALYGILEEIIAKVIPMWDDALTATEFGALKPRFEYRIHHVTELPPVRIRRGPTQPVTPESLLARNFVNTSGDLNMPEPGEYPQGAPNDTFRWLSENPVDLCNDFAQEGLQIIVKLVNIHLMPVNPQYAGSVWHVDGQLNEHICASAVYYYDDKNVTDGRLSFREATSTEHAPSGNIPRHDQSLAKRLYGLQKLGSSVQTLGSVRTKAGRLVSHPNVLQHRAESFELADRSQPGHRKMLVLHLVDPHTRIPSTAHVPPQQKDWWRYAVHRNERVARLPPEIRKMIVDTDDYAIELDEAKRIRLDLIEERKSCVDGVHERIRHEVFEFCNRSI